jgi:hypothetical protein
MCLPCKYEHFEQVYYFDVCLLITKPLDQVVYQFCEDVGPPRITAPCDVGRCLIPTATSGKICYKVYQLATIDPCVADSTENLPPL